MQTLLNISKIEYIQTGKIAGESIQMNTARVAGFEASNQFIDKGRGHFLFHFLIVTDMVQHILFSLIYVQMIYDD